MSSYSRISLFVTAVLFCLVFASMGFVQALDDKQVDTVYASIFAMQKHVEAHIANHELKAEHQTCLNNVDSLVARLASQTKLRDSLSEQLKDTTAKIAQHKDYIAELEKTYKKEHAAWIKEKKAEEDDIRAQIAAIEEIKTLARTLMQKNERHSDVVDRIIAILDDILKHLKQRLDDLQTSKVLERIQHKLDNAKLRLTHLEDLLKKTKKSLADAEKLIADLSARIKQMKQVCSNLNDKLKAQIEALKRDVKLLQKVLDLLTKLKDEQKAKKPSTGTEADEALNYDKVYKLVQDLVDTLKKEIVGLEDPAPKCKAEQDKLNDLIKEKTQKEKETQEKLAKLQNQLGTKAQDIQRIKTDYQTIEGELRETTEQCKKLGQNISKDKDLLDELAAIAQIMQLVHKMNTEEKKLSDETAQKMTTLLQKIKDELLALIAAKLKKAQDAYAQCKKERGELMIRFEKRGKELHELTALLEELQHEIKETKQLLDMLREDKKSLVDLLASTQQKCSTSISAYEKLKAEHQEDLDILDSIVALLKKKAEESKKE